ncbi:type I-E CRISPR-associated protein Cse2/CasB [Streptomyces sp. NPDC047085]|uniref:type I-E CRISPR-associated protein Cse2/CasB n=1 Tax=Streptomyces sp. NPDC047085 TaxID=3155140 RepID=UPI0033FAC071
MPSRDEYRLHYDTFVTHIRDLCSTPRIRRLLENGRGKPVTDCPDMDKYLIKPSHGFGARRAHYTIASLIAQERPAPDWTPPTASTAPSPPKDTEPRTPSTHWHTRPNLGRTLAGTAHTHPHTGGGLERDLQVLTRLSTDQLHRRLPHVVGRLLKLGARCDFAVLLEDLAHWDWARPEVSGRWRNGFYLTAPETLPED